MEAEAHRELMEAAIAQEVVAHQAALAGESAASRDAFRGAARSYRASWEAASPTSFGRLVGMLKAAILAGDGTEEAEYVERTLAGGESTSPTAAYAQSVAALTLGRDLQAEAWAAWMRGASPAFERTASAIVALVDGDAAGYREALAGIVEDFGVRERHLTGVPIADTALMLEALAARRGMQAGLEGPLMPGVGRQDTPPAPPAGSSAEPSGPAADAR